MWFLMRFFSRSTVCVLWNSLAIRWVSGSCFPGLARRCAIRCSFRVLFAWVGGDYWVLGFGASLTIDLQKWESESVCTVYFCLSFAGRTGREPRDENPDRSLLCALCGDLPLLVVVASRNILMHARCTHAR